MDRHIAGIPQGHHGCLRRSSGAGDAVPRGASLGDGAVFAYRPRQRVVPVSGANIASTRRSRGDVNEPVKESTPSAVTAIGTRTGPSYPIRLWPDPVKTMP